MLILYEEQTIEPEVIQEPEYTIIYDIINLDTYICDQLSGSIYSSSGCGPTSAAMLLSSERDIEISKDDIITTAYDNGFYYDVGVNFTSGRGVTLENIRDLINYYGQEAVIDHLWNYSNDEIVNTINSKLDEGHRIICGHRTFSGSLHYFVIYGKYRTKKYLYIKILDRKLTGSQLFDTFEEAKKEMADDYYRLLDNSSSGEYELEEKEAWINDINNDKDWDGYIREVLI